MPSCLARRAAHEIDHLVAEVLGIAKCPAAFDLLQFVVQCSLSKEYSPVFGIDGLLILDPEVGVGDVTVEDVLAHTRNSFQIGLWIPCR